MLVVVKLVSAGADLICPKRPSRLSEDSNTLEDDELGADREALAATIDKRTQELR